MASRLIASQRDEGELRAMRFAMRISLAFGVLMLAGKITAYLMTGSAAILSDAAESVIDVVAVAFAAFSLRLSTKPAKPSFLYGYERITFFSAGFEGAMIVLAAIFILYAAIEKWLTGLRLENLGSGTALVLTAGMLNAGLGWYLIRTGRRSHSLILEANGKHVITDSWTSFGVVAGLGAGDADQVEALRSSAGDCCGDQHSVGRWAPSVALGCRTVGPLRPKSWKRKYGISWMPSAVSWACNITACATVPRGIDS